MEQVSFPTANKAFPVPPEGQHSVIVVRATFKMMDNKFSPSKGPQPVLCIMMQSDQKYTNDDGEEKNHNLFKMLKISDHEMSSMHDFFKSCVGIDVPFDAEKKEIVFTQLKQEFEDGRGEKQERIVFPQFENLQFSVVVKHKQGDDGDVRSIVDSWFASPEQKESNAQWFNAPPQESTSSQPQSEADLPDL